MARLFDNNDVIEINLLEWHDDIRHDKDLSMEVLKVNKLPYNAVLDAYEVCDTNEYTNLAVCWELCKGEFFNDEDPEENRYAICQYDKKSTRFLAYMREKAIDSLMQTYLYNERANHCPQDKVEQFNKMLRKFLEERMLDELEGSRVEWLHDKVSEMWQDFCDNKEEEEMVWSQDSDCWLLEAERNGLNFLILEDEFKERYIIFDWDVSYEKVNAIIEKFMETGLSEDDFKSDAKWEEGNFRKKHRFTCCKILA